MLTCTNNKLRSWAQMLGACVLVATLSACGGGGDDTATPTPTPAPSLSSGYTQTGNLNYLVTVDNGGTRTVAATVAYSAPNGTLTLGAGTDTLTVTTTNAWGSITWPAGVSGAVRADGNVGLVCAGGAGEVGMSHNMRRVTDLTVLRGLSFRFTGCTSTGLYTDTTNLTFNADGSATYGTATISAAAITAEFSDAGLTEADTSNYKLRLYAHTVGGVTQYHMVGIVDEFVATGQPRFKYVYLISPAP